MTFSRLRMRYASSASCSSVAVLEASLRLNSGAARAGRIAALVLLGTFARYPDGERYAQQIAVDVREAGSMRAFGELRAAKLGLPPARLQETIEQFACKSMESFLAATQATWTGDYLALLATIDVPVLVAYGEHDRVAPRGLSEQIASGIAGAELAMISGAGHVANADEPAAFNALLRVFLDAQR